MGWSRRKINSERLLDGYFKGNIWEIKLIILERKMGSWMFKEMFIGRRLEPQFLTPKKKYLALKIFIVIELLCA